MAKLCPLGQGRIKRGAKGAAAFGPTQGPTLGIQQFQFKAATRRDSVSK